MSTESIKKIIAALTGKEEKLWRRVSKISRSDGFNERVFKLKDQSRSLTIKGDDAESFEILDDSQAQTLPEPQRLFTPDELDGAARVLDAWLANNHNEADIAEFPMYRHAIPGLFSVSIGLALYQEQWDEEMVDEVEGDEQEVRHVPLSMKLSELKHTLSMVVVMNDRAIEGCEEDFLLLALPDWFERECEGTLSVSKTADMTVEALIDELSKVGLSMVQGEFQETVRLDLAVGQFIAKIPNRRLPRRRSVSYPAP